MTYHESYSDAQGNIPLFGDPLAYANTSNPQIVYVRATNNASPEACYEIVELELIVNPLPDRSVEISDYIICEAPANGMAIFDLTTKIDEILNGQDPSIFQVSFYESQAEADGMLNPILNTTAYANLTNPQEIFVGILNTLTGCYVSSIVDAPNPPIAFSFLIEEREDAIATMPIDPYAICDNLDSNDGFGLFTLHSDPLNPTDLDAQSDAFALEILGSQDPTIFILTYHLSLEDATLGVGALPNLYENIINPQQIYARVSQSVTECFDVTQVILKVERLPEIVLEDQYRLCVDESGAPIASEEGGESPPIIDTGLDPLLYSFVWLLDDVVLFGQIGASIAAIQGGVYTVMVTELSTGCMSDASTTVVVSSPPFEYDARVVSGAFASTHLIEATASGLGTYVFQLDDGLFQDGGIFANVSAGNHLITIKDVNGCGSVVIELGVIDYPRFVTPNEDGYHDTWNIIGIANGDTTAKIYIFDRFGKLLKQISPSGPGWDGNYNGNPLPSSDYWFLVEYTEDGSEKEFRGHFTLKR